MKKVRIGFAALVAILAMSFTIASHSKVFKKRDLSNCYQTITTAKYLSTCASTPVFTTITCSNKTSAIGQVLKNDLSLAGFSTTSVTCAGGSTLCCMSLKSQSTDPCTNATASEQTGDGSLKDFNGNTITLGNYVLVNDIQCKQ